MINIYIVLEMQNLLLKQIVRLNLIFYQFVLDTKINMSMLYYYLLMI